MRHYEIMLLIHPDQSERARVMMDRYTGIIESGQGQVHRQEDLGRRMLAYPIAKVQKAHYMLINVECGQETLEELVGALHFSDAVLRHLVVRCDKAISEQSALARAAEKEAARENREYPYDREMAHGKRAGRGEAAPAATDESATEDAPPAEAAAEEATETVEAAAEEATETAEAAVEEATETAEAAVEEEAPPDEAASGEEETPAEPETDEAAAEEASDDASADEPEEESSDSADAGEEPKEEKE